MSSTRQRILEALKARAEEITTANGFQTDLGKHVLLGEIPTFGEADPPQVLCILPQEDQVTVMRGRKLILTLPVDFAVIVKTGQCGWANVEAGIADVKKAVELADATLGGLLRAGNENDEGLQRGTTEPLERSSGSAYIGASITYGCQYSEAWGSPER